jgi:hypothetical protein
MLASLPYIICVIMIIFLINYVYFIVKKIAL